MRTAGVEASSAVAETANAYHRAHQRTIRRLHTILARKREIPKWNRSCGEWAVRWGRTDESRNRIEEVEMAG
ncbi:hypothetical protein KCP75_03560 [Salmonella enterica subsp. enterica]|nr:hypothetical protein KCP75_03560 [Salmonella enterica subsp. enterica]